MSKSITNFADRLHHSIEKKTSFLVAGFDPVLDSIPSFITNEAKKNSKGNDAFYYNVITRFYVAVLESVYQSVAAIKPNLAFYEQFGMGGLTAYRTLCKACTDLGLPVIADAKRGDIGSTAQAYADAFLTQGAPFEADALTVNPFLGLDTVEPFVKACKTHGKGIFVLVKTSNPGSAALQSDTSKKIAEWIAKEGGALKGECGYSSLGAVVGATHPNEARELRTLMPDNFCLIPGYGAQGGSAADAVAGFSAKKHGAIINVSRALCGSIPPEVNSNQSLQNLLQGRVRKMNNEIAQALA